MLIPTYEEVIADLRVLQRMPDITVRIVHPNNGRIVITTVQAQLGLLLAYLDDRHWAEALRRNDEHT